jgi:hypothetical protein
MAVPPEWFGYMACIFFRERTEITHGEEARVTLLIGDGDDGMAI